MPGRISCPTLVGREGEFQRIVAHLGSEDRAVLLVAGDAGIGKSRLVGEALSRATAAGSVVLAGASVPIAGHSLPYGPIVDALRRGRAGGGGASLRRLGKQLDALRSVSEGGQGTTETSAQGPILEAVLEGLEAAAEETPVVLSVDDLHWSDAATRDLLLFLAQSRWSGRVRLVGTVRTDEDHGSVGPMLIELNRAGLLDRLDLAPLADDAVNEMIAGILGTRPPEQLVDAVRRRSGGNPFFVEELVATARTGDSRLPPSIGDILLARLASLPEPVQELLRQIAVLGDRVSESLVAAVSGEDPAALAPRLRAAVDAHVLLADREAGTVAFRHALMREVLYADLMAGERRAMHERVARRLESDDASRLLTPTARALALAVHWDGAGDAANAVPALIAGAEAATAAHAHADALGLYRRCLARIEERPDIARDAGLAPDLLYESAALAAFLSDDTQTAIELARRAITLAGTADVARAGLLRQQLCEHLWGHGALREALEVAREAYELVPPDGDPAARAAVVGAWASALGVLSRYDEALAVSDEAVELGRMLGDAAVTSMGLVSRGVAMANVRDVEAGLRDVSEAIELARGCNVADVQLIAFMNGAWTIATIGGEPRRALELIAEWKDLQRTNGLDRTRGTWMAGFEADLLMRLGRWEEADQALTGALRLPPGRPSRHEALQNAAQLWTWQGRWDEATEVVREILEIAEPTRLAEFIGPSFAAAIDLALWQGDPSRGVALVRAADRLLPRPEDPLFTRQLYAVVVRACVEGHERTLGRRSQAERAELRDAAERYAARARYEGVPNLTAALPETRAWTAQAAAELTRLEPSATAAQAWHEVGSAWQSLGYAARESYAALREAEAWLACGGRDEASRAVAAAREKAASVGATSVVSAADRLTVRARLGPRPATAELTPRTLGLTHRESEVLGLVARGLTNRQIADELFISEKTAGVHVSSILAKLDVSSRAQAAAMAVRHEGQRAER